MMKRIRISTAAAVAIYAVCLFVCVWAAWYFYFYYAIVWYEGYSFFTTQSDTMMLAAIFPDAILKYIGAFLLQFFYYPALGAAIEAAFSVFVFLCAAVVVRCLFNRPLHLLWTALIPVAIFAEQSFWDSNLTVSLKWCLWSLLAAVSVWCLKLAVRQRINMPRIISNFVVGGVASVAMLWLVVYNLVFKNGNWCAYQDIWRMEYLAETRQWDALLEVTTPAVAQMNEIARRYAVLALLEKGQLADNMFLYSVTNSKDLWFKGREEPMCRNYNAMLFRSLGMPNEVVHQTFQQQIQSEFGTSFTVLRRLVEINLETKNYALAKKYMDILSHSTVMKGWVDERKPQLEAIRKAKPVFEEKGKLFYTTNILKVTAEMYNRYPDNRKYADMFLCGLLADKNDKEFYSAFQVIATTQYAHGERIPRYYQEALMLVSVNKPEVLQEYSISRDVQEDFKNVMALVKKGDVVRMRDLYPNTLWAYCL